MTNGDRKMVVIARLRAAPLVGWQFACAVLLGVLAARLNWEGDPIDALRNMIFGQPLLLLGIAAVLTVWGYVFGMWRRRGAYLRHDGVTLYRGGSARERRGAAGYGALRGAGRPTRPPLIVSLR